MRELEAIFSRDGFTDAYFKSNISRSMLGVRSEQQKRITRELEPFSGIGRRISVDMSVAVKANTPISLTVTRIDNGKTVTVTGDVPFAARTAPIDEATVSRSLSKLGDTPFALNSIRMDIDEGLMVPVSVLNSLRRNAVEILTDSDKERKNQITHIPYQRVRSSAKRDSSTTAIFYRPDMIPRSAYDFFDIIYTPLDKYNGKTKGVALPPVIFDSEREEVEKLLLRAKALGAEHVLVGNIGHLDIVRNSGMRIHGDFRLNVCNNTTVMALENMGVEDVIVSPELTMAQIRDIGGRSFAVTYGRIPLMITEKCVSSEIADCDRCKKGTVMLTDRKGVCFPVLKEFSHRSLIVNSVPIYMADRQEILDKNKISMCHFIFTTETSQEADNIIRAYQKRLPPKDSTKVKRIK
jgi:putative protease